LTDRGSQKQYDYDVYAYILGFILSGKAQEFNFYGVLFLVDVHVL